MTSTNNKRGDGRHGTVIMASSSRRSLDLAAEKGHMRANVSNKCTARKTSEGGALTVARAAALTCYEQDCTVGRYGSFDCRKRVTKSSSRGSGSSLSARPLALAPPSSRPHRSQSRSKFNSSERLSARQYNRAAVPKKAARRPRFPPSPDSGDSSDFDEEAARRRIVENQERKKMENWVMENTDFGIDSDEEGMTCAQLRARRANARREMEALYSLKRLSLQADNDENNPSGRNAPPEVVCVRLKGSACQNLKRTKKL